MDRDQRWDRTDKAYEAIVHGEGAEGSDPVKEVQRSYDEGVTDEFIVPVVIEGRPRLGSDDSVIFFFGQGQMFAEAAGATQAPVPRAVLAPLLA